MESLLELSTALSLSLPVTVFWGNIVRSWQSHEIAVDFTFRNPCGPGGFLRCSGISRVTVHMGQELSRGKVADCRHGCSGIYLDGGERSGLARKMDGSACYSVGWADGSRCWALAKMVAKRLPMVLV